MALMSVSKDQHWPATFYCIGEPENTHTITTHVATFCFSCQFASCRYPGHLCRVASEFRRLTYSSFVSCGSGAISRCQERNASIASGSVEVVRSIGDSQDSAK